MGGDLLADGGHGGVLMAEEHQVAVDLVADDKGAVLHAQLTHAAQLLGSPHPANGIVGVAENEDGGLALEGVLKGLEVHVVAAVFVLFQGDGQGFAVPVLHRVIKLAVNRSQEQDLITGIGELPHTGAQGRDHAQAEQAALDIGPPAVALLLPVAHGLEIGVGAAGVAEHSLLVARVDGIQDGLGRAQVHVRDPHGDQIPAAVPLFQFIVLCRKIVPAVNGLIKIVLHLISHFP